MGDGKLLTPRICHHEVKGLSLLQSKHVNKALSEETSRGMDNLPAGFSSNKDRSEAGRALIRLLIHPKDIGIPSLVDEVPTHSPSIPRLARTLPSPGQAAKYWNQGRLTTIDKRIHWNRERGIPCAF